MVDEKHHFLDQERWSKICIFIFVSYVMLQGQNAREEIFNLNNALACCLQAILAPHVHLSCPSGQKVFPASSWDGLGFGLLQLCSQVVLAGGRSP